ncbi:hypothetical protein [Polynucleobacter sp. 80A-SIGWE]|uniref:hypothetical protein n=1 Tax=Polynucleobacter sp. 80A-SIGWE TaxID=2689100 RepID=UPI001C0E0F6A|nr:hypothetical protein [Polynucleobacter sp. 80A-SIGWE]MBU3588520.1 hypothetical protein [Polynucleobacter sp. 80A-SIGWE]
MSNLKQPMSGSYKAVFAFAIFMMFVLLLGGSKGGAGVLLWGYTAWLMYKRNNQSLVSLYKVLLWFEVIVGGIGLVVLAFNEDDGATIFAYAALILLAIAISFGLLKFFESQIAVSATKTSNNLYSNTSAVTASSQKTIVDSDDAWEMALNEFNSANRNEGLWAKCFANNHGDENKAKADYLKEVVARASVPAALLVQSKEVIHTESLRPLSVDLNDVSKNEEATRFSKEKKTGNDVNDEFSSAANHDKSNETIKYIVFIVTLLLIVTLIFIGIRSFENKSSYSSEKPIPTFSGQNKSSYADRRSYTMEKIKEGSLIVYPAKVELFNDVSKIYALPWNAYSKALSTPQIEIMENNNLWWIEKNNIFIRLYNPNNRPITSAIFSLKHGKCAIKEGEKIYLLLGLNDTPLPVNGVRIYKGELPFEYKKFYGESLNCGDIVGGFSAP